MQFRTVAIIASLSALTLAQNLPACAVPCFTAAQQNMTDCSPTDTVCICTTGKSQFTSLVTPCVMSSCSTADQSAAVAAAAVLCAAAGASGAVSGSSSAPAATGGSATGSSGGALTTASGSATSSGSAAKATSNSAMAVAPFAGFGTMFGLVAAGLMAL